ncbi:hypothetical protein RIR_jg33669.t1 [Rhizophagus irregularis DAOM 181602=DAOM 197198]|uniref:Uncharacterized protein n=1 Tax=Rhizophagus irregularis TaxID=588596 RepID=A0A2N1NMP2_9GLOM|nr:hypothetical protein RhiirC2_257220 [Rhizophagus irregularis]GET61856.1 hypothetical protein RIR_jg33669.t1 [Rhizophagus irregularis DAOM 181602=DAOM 197198]
MIMYVTCIVQLYCNSIISRVYELKIFIRYYIEDCALHRTILRNYCFFIVWIFSFMTFFFISFISCLRNTSRKFVIQCYTILYALVNDFV